MNEWWKQFAVKYEQLASVFTTPTWYSKHMLVESAPQSKFIEKEIWSLTKGYYALARDKVLKQDGSGYLNFEQPAVLILYIANSIEAVLYHLHEITMIVDRTPINESHPSGFPHFDYEYWTTKFKNFESASYRHSDGLFVDKQVSIDKITICFLDNKERKNEFPYLVEIREEIAQ